MGFSGSGSSAAGVSNTPWVTYLIVLVVVLILELFSIYKSWKRGVLFSNLLRSAFVHGLPLLMIAAFFFFVLLPNGRGWRGGGSDSANAGGNFSTGIYQEYQEDIDE